MDARWELANKDNKKISLEQFADTAQQLKEFSEKNFKTSCTMNIRVMNQYRDRCSVDMFMDMFETVHERAEESTFLRTSDAKQITPEAWAEARSIDVSISPVNENNPGYASLEYHADESDTLSFYCQAGKELSSLDTLKKDVTDSNRHMLLDGESQDQPIFVLNKDAPKKNFWSFVSAAFSKPA